MPLFDENALEKRATSVVSRFFTEKTALTDGVVDAAQEDNLNPEQVRRLVEAVNNMTFLKKFEGAPDRLSASEFEPADADAALQQLLEAASTESNPGAEAPPAESHSMTADDLAALLPLTHPGAPPSPPPAPQAPPEEAKLSSLEVTHKLRKTAEALKMQRYQAQFQFTDTFQKLATNFTKLDNQNFESFEQDALYKWGAEAIPHLGALRASLRKPAATYDPNFNVKTARVIDSRTPTLQLFNNLLKFSQDMIKTAQAEEKAQEYIKRVTTVK